MVLRYRSRHPRCLHPFRLLLAVLLLAVAAAPLSASWPAVDPAELKATKPRIDPEAGAEILLKEVEIQHQDFENMQSTYHVRVKIFSARGLDDFAKIEIPYDNYTTITGVAARTIKADGTIIELSAKEIYDREVIKTNKARVKVKSFAPPGLEVGAIVEYRYTEESDDVNYFVTLSFNSEQPSWDVRFRYQPITGFSSQVYVRWLLFNMSQQTNKADGNDYYNFRMTNLPATRDEPFAPPSYNTTSSALIYYSLSKNQAPDEYWRDAGKDLANDETKRISSAKTLKPTLATIVADGDSESVKLHKIYDYCRTKIVNRDRDTATFSREQRDKLKENKTAADTLKRGYGTSEDVNVLFAALARAAGFDAHLAQSNRRTLMLFNKQVTEPFMAPDIVVVVRVDGVQRYFDPGATYLPYGMLAWQNTDTGILIAAPKDAKFTIPDGPAASENLERRRAHFTLDADGTLEGDVAITYTGQREAEMKYTLDDLTPTEREDYYRDALKENLKQADLTQFKIEHAADPLEPLSVSYHLRVPEYADRTGSRLFFQPAVFQKNETPLFSETKRRADIMMHYSNVTRDEIRFTLPANFVIEQANAPGNLPIGDLGKYEVVLGENPATKDIHYNRTLTLTDVYIPVKYYESVRNAFEAIHRMDTHTLTLKHVDSSEKPAVPTADAKSTN